MKKIILVIITALFCSSLGICDLLTSNTTWNLKMKTSVDISEAMLTTGKVSLCNFAGLEQLGDSYKLYPNAKKTKWKNAKNHNVSIKYNLKTKQMNLSYKKMPSGILELTDTLPIYTNQYTVEYYLMETNRMYGSAANYTNVYSGTTDTTVYAPTNSYTGFTFDTTNGLNILSGKVAADGTLVLKLYYVRNGNGATPNEQYVVHYFEDHGYTNEVIDNNSGNNHLYGTTITYTNEMQFKKLGYTFVGWTNETLGGTVALAGNTFSMPDSSVTNVAIWSANTNTLYVETHYLMNTNRTYVILANYRYIRSGVTDTTVYAPTNSYEGFTFDTTNGMNIISGNVAGDGKLLLKMYYVRNGNGATPNEQYVVHYFEDNGYTNEIVDNNSGNNYLYEETVTYMDERQFQKAGYYIFMGWSNETLNTFGKTGSMFTMPNSSVTNVAIWSLVYMIIDISGGSNAVSYPVTYHSNFVLDVNDETYKTDKLVLRQIPAGKFIMGSPTNELGRDNNETQHEVTISKPYYIGVYEVTQVQWSNVMGRNPYNANGATMPLNDISYTDIRGASLGTNWPENNLVDAGSFMGKLRAKTGNVFDLPTEAQWEYACRAETTTAMNNGKDLTNTISDASMDEVGRYNLDLGECAIVGMYVANAWGLFDMHGNIREWCLDKWDGRDYAAGSVIDPKGMAKNIPSAVARGGNCNTYAKHCRSASRNYFNITDRNVDLGFRIACQD